jgi:hypothetical protein
VRWIVLYLLNDPKNEKKIYLPVKSKKRKPLKKIKKIKKIKLIKLINMSSDNEDDFADFLNSQDTEETKTDDKKQDTIDSSDSDQEINIDEITNHQPDYESEYSDSSSKDDEDKLGILTDSDVSSDDDEEKTSNLIKESESFVLNLEKDKDISSDDDQYSDDDGYEEYKRKKKKGSLTLSDLNPDHEYKCACCNMISSSWVVLACEYCERTVFCAKCFRTYDRTMKSNPDNCIIKMKCDHCKKEKLKVEEIQYIDSVQQLFAESTTIQCPLCTQEVGLSSINKHIENTCSSKDLNKRMKLQNMLNNYNRTKEAFKKRSSKKKLNNLLILGELASKNDFISEQEKENARRFIESNNEPDIRLSDDNTEQKMFELLLQCKDTLPRCPSFDLSSTSSSSSSSSSSNSKRKRKLHNSFGKSNNQNKVKRKKQKKLVASVITRLNFYK